MNKKSIIVVTIILALVVIAGLWVSGIIPKKIAKICATNYLKKNFPKAQLEYVDIEWSSSHGGYLIRFKDENNRIHGFIINNKYFPIKLGQGIFAFREEYTEKYDKVEGDADTIGACTGGLAGIFYGLDNINQLWKNDLLKYDYTINLCNKFNEVLNYGE